MVTFRKGSLTQAQAYGVLGHSMTVYLRSTVCKHVAKCNIVYLENLDPRSSPVPVLFFFSSKKVMSHPKPLHQVYTNLIKSWMWFKSDVLGMFEGIFVASVC